MPLRLHASNRGTWEAGKRLGILERRYDAPKADMMPGISTLLECRN